MSTDLHPSTQLLQRNSEQFHGRILLVQPVEIAAIEVLQTIVPSLTVSTTQYDIFQAAEKLVPAQFETHHVATKPYDQVIVFLPKSDAEIAMTLHWAAHTIKQEGEVILVGQNDAGIKSAKKTLEAMIGPISHSDAARHSALYVARRTHLPPVFDLFSYFHNYEVALPTSHFALGTLHCYSLPGVFSHGRLDEGTELLLANLPEHVQAKNILDWGCGAGVIGAVLSHRYPESRIDLTDVSALAIAATEKTIQENNLANCRVFPSAVFSGVKGAYDYILANPPFHKGRDTHYGDSETFLKQAKQHLTEHGQLIIVANSFLHYEQFIEESFGYVQTITKTNKYKVLQTVKTPKQGVKKFKKKSRTPDEAQDESMEW